MGILDALLNRKTVQPSSPTPMANGQIVPVAFLIEPPSELTSGSDLNRASSGWPGMLDGGAKLWNNNWRKSVLVEVEAHNTPGNYGLVTSQAHFGWRYRAFGGIGNMPGPIPTPYRPTWQSLVPINWGVRVPNPNINGTTTEQHGPISVQTQPSTWQGPNTASLMKTGEVLL